MTLLLSRSNLVRVLDIGECLNALRQGFLAEPTAIEAQRVRTDLPGPGTATALIPGLADGIPAYTVKVNAKFPAARPALRGVVCLHDAGSGELLAVLDSATVTAWRTGLAAALATRVIVDDVALAMSSGALGTAGLPAAAVAAVADTLSQVLHRTTPGRQAEADITIYPPVGLPWQDLVLAWLAYRRAEAAGLGQSFDFLA